MRKIRFTALAMVLVMTITAMTGCTTYDNFKEAFFSKKGVASDTIRIGILEPQTGNDSAYGELEIQGIELARELVPEVLGKEVELIYADTQSSIYVAESATNDLIAKKPAIVLGSYGDTASLTASQLLGKMKTPAITITATNPLITANNEYYFRMAFTDESQGKALAEYVFNHLGLTEAAIIRTENEDSSTKMVSEFSKRLVKLTENENCISATVDVKVKPKKEDCKKYMEEIWNSKAKAVFMPVSLATAEEIFKQAERMGINDMTFIGPKEWHGAELIALQSRYPQAKIAVASDIISLDAKEKETEDADTTPADSGEDTSLYEQFIKAYQAKYGKNEPPEATALAFDAYMLAVQAIEKAGSIDGYLIKDALKTTSNFKGVSGDITFDETGEPKKTIHVDIIQNGKFTSVYTIN